MPTLSTTTTIAQPIERVYAYVIDVANHPAWQVGIKEARVAPPGPVVLGSTYTYTTEVMGQRIQSQLQVSGLEPNRLWLGCPIPSRRSIDSSLMAQAQS